MANNVFNILQFAGGSFPGGSFSQSWGLETYISNGAVTDFKSMMVFLNSYIDSVLTKSEGPLVKEAMKNTLEDDFHNMRSLEELSIATKLTRESRESSLRMGKAFLRICSQSIERNEKLDKINNIFQKYNVSYPVAYGIVMGVLDIKLEDALAAYLFNSVNAIIQSGIKLIPLGNTEAQKVLIQLQPKLEDAVAVINEISVDEISTFCPELDIAGMEHENLAVRLYMT